MLPLANEYQPDIITLIDEEQKEHSYEILEILERDDKEYYALYPIFDDPQEEVQDSGEYYIMESIEGEDGEMELADVEDDALLDELAEIFESHFNEEDAEEENEEE